MPLNLFYTMVQKKVKNDQKLKPRGSCLKCYFPVGTWLTALKQTLRSGWDPLTIILGLSRLPFHCKGKKAMTEPWSLAAAKHRRLKSIDSATKPYPMRQTVAVCKVWWASPSSQDSHSLRDILIAQENSPAKVKPIFCFKRASLILIILVTEYYTFKHNLST